MGALFVSGDETNREGWLKGNHRNGTLVIHGSSLRCVGCGKTMGMISIAINIDDPIPGDPDFPFREEDCPVCTNEKNWQQYELVPIEILCAQPLARLRLAIQFKKKNIHQEKHGTDKDIMDSQKE